MNWRELPYLVVQVEDMEKFGLDPSTLRKSVDGSKALIHVDKVVDDNIGMPLVILALREDYEGGCYTYDEIKELMAGVEWNISEDVIDDFFEFNKAMKIKQIKQACYDTIVAGFPSDVQGEMKLYKCDETHQANLTGQVLTASAIIAGQLPASVEVRWKAADEGECYPWDPVQIVTLGVTMQQFITACTHAEDILTAACDAATTQEELDAVPDYSVG